MELYGQAYTFVVTVLTGAFLGLMFDLYRVLRSLFRPRTAVTILADFLYWVFATVVVLLSLLMSNWLELRLYVFLGLVGGTVSYYRLLSRYAIFVLIRILRLVGWLSGWIRRIISHIVIKPVLIVLRLLSLPFVKVRRPLTSFWRRVWSWRAPKDTPPPV